MLECFKYDDTFGTYLPCGPLAFTAAALIRLLLDFFEIARQDMNMDCMDYLDLVGVRTFLELLRSSGSVGLPLEDGISM